MDRDFINDLNQNLEEQEVINVDGSGGENNSDEEEEDDARQTVDNSHVKKQRKSSCVWKYGTKIVGGAQCNLCGKKYSSKLGNTSNLINHIKIKHRGTAEEEALTKELAEEKRFKEDKLKKKKADRKQQTSLLNFINRSGSIDQKKKEKITDSIVNFVIQDITHFDVVEKPSFRKMMFTCEPNFVVPSRRTITRKIDEKAEESKKALKQEILSDLEKAGHKTVGITCDEGTSSDKFKTKKLAITIHRTTEHFELKSDTISVEKCVGSQTAATIRAEVKEELSKFGYDSSWTINWTTDGPTVMVSARAKGRHAEVGFPTNHTGTCVDHTWHLVVEEATAKVVGVRDVIFKSRKWVEWMKQSSLARQKLHAIQVDAGLNPLSVVQGTDNRWYFKYSEVKRTAQLKASIMALQDQFYERIPDRLDPFEDEDWPLMESYVSAIAPFVKATEYFSGEKYMTSSSVIPALDQITTDLEKLASGEENREIKLLAGYLLQSMKKRFPANYQNLAPYNALTFLDPRFMDLYADTDEFMRTIERDIIADACYDTLINEEARQEHEVIPEAATPPVSENSSASDRRNQLLQKKLNKQGVGGASQEQVGHHVTVAEKIKKEIDRYVESSDIFVLKISI